MRVLCFVVVLVAGLATGALSETPADALAGLEAAVKKEAETRKPDGSPDNGIRRNQIQTDYTLSQLRSLITRGDVERAEELLNQAGQFYFTGEEAKAATNLGAVLRKERENKVAARKAEAEALLKRAGDAVRNAKDAKDLDPILVELTTLRDRVEERSNNTAFSNKISPTIMFVQRWQEYLAAMKNGNVKGAQSALRSAMDNQGFDIVPRSEILERIQRLDRGEDKNISVKQEQIDEMVSKIKTLDGIEAGIAELKGLAGNGRPNASYNENDPLGGTVLALSTIDHIYKESQAGLPLHVEQGGLRLPNSASSKVIALKVQLFLAVIPRYLNASGNMLPKPVETVDAYVQRVTDHAKAAGDLQLMARARDVQRWLAGTYQGGYENNPGITMFTAGQNQEIAGQYMLAIMSYQNALKVGRDDVPAKAIGDRLKALKAEHPAEFDEAMKNVVSPVSRREGFPGMPGTGPYPMGPGQNGPERTVVLPLPSASVTPSLTPATSTAPASKPTSSPAPSSADR